MHRLFGGAVPLSSTKSFFGHTLGASGVLETIATLLLVKEGVAPHGLRHGRAARGMRAARLRAPPAPAAARSAP